MPSRLRRMRSTIVLALVALAAMPAVGQAAAPANDDLAGAQVVRIGDRATGTIADATMQAGEPSTTSPLIDHTVWYRLTTTATERVRIDTCGANPYSEIDVFTGASVDALTEVAQGDYGCTTGGRVYLDAVAGTTYHVRVSGYEWGGAIALTVARPQAPANDNFADAEPVGFPATARGTNVDATVEPGEVDPIPGGSAHSVWYRYTAATNEPLLISLADCAEAGGAVWTLTVYTGDRLGALTEVGDFAPACGYRTKLALFPKAGTTYRIAIRGAGPHAADAFTLRLAPIPSPPDPGRVPRAAEPEVPVRARRAGLGDLPRHALRRRRGLRHRQAGLLRHLVVSPRRPPARPLHPVRRRALRARAADHRAALQRDDELLARDRDVRAGAACAAPSRRRSRRAAPASARAASSTGRRRRSPRRPRRSPTTCRRRCACAPRASSTRCAPVASRCASAARSRHAPRAP